MTSMYKDTPADIDHETLLALGAELRCAGFVVPPVTIGAIALLDLIDSPFVSGQRDPELFDVFRALYVLTAKDKAASAILSASRAARALDSLRDQCATSPEMSATYYAAVASASQGWVVFDKQVAEFADGCGQFDLSVATLALRDAISKSTGGFSLIPPNDATEKKTASGTHLTASGSRKWWRSFRRFVTLGMLR